MLDAADLAAAAGGTLDVAELVVGLKAAGINDNHGLAADLADRAEGARAAGGASRTGSGTSC